jgi:hypothetical protein
MKSWWCPISQDYVSTVTAAHIVPVNVGETQSGYLFGEAENPGQGHLMCPSNRLILHPDFEGVSDDGRLIVVASSGTDVDPETQAEAGKMFPTDSNLFKFQVLDKVPRDPEIQGRLGCVKRQHVHGRILQFRNEKRPKKRYLFFTAVMSLARRHWGLVDGGTKTQKF